jgi:hypothetical protein
MGLFDNLTNTNTIGGAIDNFVKDKPAENSLISTAINNEVNNNPNKFNWGKFGAATLGNMKFGGGYSHPNVTFNPTMMQAQYLDAGFNNQNTDMGNLYNYLTR